MAKLARYTKTAVDIVECTIDKIPVIYKVVNGIMKKFTIVPPLYEKGRRYRLDQAKEILSKRGLRVTEVELSLQDASAKYRKCFDFQVIDSRPKQRCLIPIGSEIAVTYITQEVIDECKRIFEKKQQQKDRMQTKQITRKKKMASNTVDKLNESAKKIHLYSDKTEHTRSK